MTQTKLKIIWFCNCLLSEDEADGTGSWLGAMARGLLDSGAIELGIIAPGPVRRFTRRDYHQVKQWLVPMSAPSGRDDLPRSSLVSAIVVVVNEFTPDLVHTWGTEGFWGLLCARGRLAYPSLLEMQGLKGEIAKTFYGNMSFQEKYRSIGIKELIKHRTMNADKRDFVRWGLREKEIIRGHCFVDVQTAWVASHVRAVNLHARLFSTDLALRQEFSGTGGWQPTARATIFCTAAYPFPFKGLHVAVRALAILRKRIPDVRLRIAGPHQRAGLRQEGYIRWINRMVREAGLTDAIDWLGTLEAGQIVTELENAAAIVIPTFAENCCTAMQEAMAVGTPVVVSHAGGIPSLAKDDESCLFYPPGDEAMCAYQLERVMTDKKLALRLSQESRKIAVVRNDIKRIVQRQLEIYRQVLDEGVISSPL